MSLPDRINAAAKWVPVWAVYLVCIIPVPVLLYMGATGGLGREPIAGLEHELGEIAIQLLIVGLCVSPLRRYLGVNLMKFRRAIGLLAFIYVSLHLLVWAVLDVQSLERVWADILKRPYISVGMGAFVLMLPMALTSNNRSIRSLGPRWRSIHYLVYPVALLAALHFIWVRRGFQIEPLIYMGVICALVLLRLRPGSKLLQAKARS